MISQKTYKSKKLNRLEKAIIHSVAFILFFDFILYPFPIMAKESAFNNYFSLQLSGLKSDNEVNFCQANETASVTNIGTGNETTPALIGLRLIDSADGISDITDLKVINHGYHQLTAYTSEAAQTDDDPCTTANGFNVCKHGIEDTIAANFLKFGTKVRIPELFGNKVFVVRDRMNKRHPERLDVWFKDKPAALKFGIKLARIEVVENNN